MMNHEEPAGGRVGDVMQLLRRRRKLITACAILGALLAGFIATSIPPRYTAKAQLLVARPGAGPSETVDEAIVDTHVQLIMSPRHLRTVAASLEQDPGGDVLSTAPSPLMVAVRRQVAAVQGTLVDVLRSGLRVLAPSAPPATEAAAAEPAESAQFLVLQGNLSVYKELHSHVVAVAFTAQDPRRAALVANRVADVYVQDAREQILNRRSRLEKALAERIPAARAELDRAEAAVRAHRIATGLLDDTAATMMDRQISELKRQLALDMAERSEQDQRLAVLRDQGHTDDDFERLIEVLRQYSPASSFELLTASAGGAGPDPGERALMQRLIDNALVKLASDRKAIDERLGHTQQRLALLEQSRQKLSEAEAKLSDLERAAAAAAQLYESLLSQQTQLSSQEGVPQEVHIVSAALPPESPSSPGPALFVLPAFVAFGIGGALMALLLERFDKHVRRERDVEEMIGVRCLGLVPATGRWSKTRRALIDRPFDRYSEAIRSIATTAMSRRRIPRLPRGGAIAGRVLRETAVFAVTSSERSDGKTILAASLAISLATLGRRVLLIDLDLRHPEMASALDLPGRAGASPAEADTMPGGDPVTPCSEYGIDCLILSERREGAISLISTDRFATMLAGLRERYDCIVIDCPPLMGATESRLIAAHADNIILALRWARTDIDTARRALSQLRHVGIEDARERVFGVITQVNMRGYRLYREGDV